jgi:cytoskeleton protein RodZ
MAHSKLTAKTQSKPNPAAKNQLLPPAAAVMAAGRASQAMPNVPAEPTLPLHHVGHALKAAREARGLAVEDLANELMIRRYYLQAIEDGNYKTLPDRVYAMGFVRNYSDYLGLDSNALTEQFRREAYSGRQNNAKVELSFPEPVSHNIVPGKTALLAGLVLAALAVAVGLFITQPKDLADSLAVAPLKPLPSASTVPAPTTQAVANIDSTSAITTTNDTTPTDTANNATVSAPTETALEQPVVVSDLPKLATAPTPAASATPAPAVAPVPSPAMPPAVASTPAPSTPPTPAMAVVLVIKQPSWVEVRNAEGQTLLSKIAKAGDLLPLPNQKGLTLTLGNAGGVLLQVGDKMQAAFGPAGEVRRNIKLDPLLATLAPPATSSSASSAAQSLKPPMSLPAAANNTQE